MYMLKVVEIVLNLLLVRHLRHTISPPLEWQTKRGQPVPRTSAGHANFLKECFCIAPLPQVKTDGDGGGYDESWE